jgi:hypothetical protein
MQTFMFSSRKGVGIAAGPIYSHSHAQKKEPPDRAVFYLAFSFERYCFTVRGSVSLKLSMDSAGRTISFSPV